MIAVLGLVVGVVVGLWSAPEVPAVARALPADRRRRGARRRVRRAAGDAGRHLRRQGLRGLVPVERGGRRADRLPRRQAGRGRAAVHRRRRRPRHPHLLQRRRHPSARLPGVRRMSDDSTPTNRLRKELPKGRRRRLPRAGAGTGRPAAPAADRPAAAGGGAVAAAGDAGRNSSSPCCCSCLGFGLAIQVASNSDSGSALRGARQEDLVRILDELDNRTQRLEDEKQGLEDQRTELENSSDQAEEARKQTAEKETATRHSGGHGGGAGARHHADDQRHEGDGQGGHAAGRDPGAARGRRGGDPGQRCAGRRRHLSRRTSGEGVSVDGNKITAALSFQGHRQAAGPRAGAQHPRRCGADSGEGAGHRDGGAVDEDRCGCLASGEAA